MAGPVDVFISYAPADDALHQELKRHLAVLQRAGVIRTWSEQLVAAGDDWSEAVEAQLAAADVVLLLMSADYLASDYLCEVQAMTALARRRAGDARVIPVLLRDCDWAHAPFEGLSPLPPDRRPVSSWPNRDEAWTAVARGIRRAITGTEAPVVAPQPAYESEEIRALAEEVERARSRKAALAAAGASTAEIDGEILQMRRRLREGGQLRAGDALGDGRYLLLHSLGQGGFAAVWAAHDRRLDEQVAIKVLHPSLARDASRCERFFRGARVMQELQHEGVVRVLEPHGKDGGYLFFVMELVAGKDLHRAVLEKRLGPEDVAPAILRIAEALGEAHARGIVHRDVKPANVVLDGSGMPKLTDFDLVAAKDTTGGTRTGALGTFVFTAPEQLHNAKEADARADVYGLGMTALFCLHGRELPPIVTRKPELVIDGLSCSDAVKTVIARAIEFEPESRYADAPTFREAWRAAAMPAPSLPSPPPPRPVPPVPAAPDVARRIPTPPGAVGLVAPSVPEPRVRGSRGMAARRRWPFGSGFHDPDFEAPIDAAAHLELIPAEATCKGFFIIDTLQQASKVTTEADQFRVAGVPARRYTGFRDYPFAEALRIMVAAALVLYPRYPLGEGLRRLGQTAFDALLATHVGRSLFDFHGRDVEPLLLGAPKAFKLILGTSQVTAEKTAYRTFTFRASQFPAFLETYQVGVLEGMVRYCGERARIRIALEDLSTAEIELRLL